MSRRSWAVVCIGLGILVGVPLLRSGTLTPCGMVEFEVRRALADETTRQLSASPTGPQAAGTIMGAALADRVVQQWMGGKGPIDCMFMLGRIIRAGGFQNIVAASAAAKRAEEAKAAAELAYTIQAVTIARAPVRIVLQDRTEPAEEAWESGDILFYRWKGEMKRVPRSNVVRIEGVLRATPEPVVPVPAPPVQATVQPTGPAKITVLSVSAAPTSPSSSEWKWVIVLQNSGGVRGRTGFRIEISDQNGLAGTTGVCDVIVPGGQTTRETGGTTIQKKIPITDVQVRARLTDPC